MNENTPGGSASPTIRVAAEANLPSRFGDFTVHAFDVSVDGQEYGAVVKGDVRGGVAVPCLLYTSPSPRDLSTSRMPSSA